MSIDSNTPLVSICSITYNHKFYIRDTIEGFLMQKTSFPFEIIIHDDASTDGTTDIIKEYQTKYPDKIFPIYQTENQYSKGVRGIAAKFTYPRARGKYIAICEGDDYWIDPYKLQKQVNFLEANEDYGLTYSRARVYDEHQKKIMQKPIGELVKDFNSLILKNRIPTLTTVFRKSLIKDFDEIITKYGSQWNMGDYPLWLLIASRSKIKFFEDITAVYRKNLNSASQFQDPQKKYNFSKSTLQIQLYFCQHFSKNENLEKKLVNNSHKKCLRYAVQMQNEDYLDEIYAYLRTTNRLRIIPFIHFLSKRGVDSWLNKIILRFTINIW